MSVGERRVVAEDADVPDVGELLRLGEERLLVLRGAGRVDQVPALVRVGVVAHRARLGEGEDGVEGVLLGHLQVTRLGREPSRRRDHEGDRDQRRGGERGVHQPPEAG